jgi:hypothetical protein
MRSKLGERTGGGAFQLRKTFKFFDKDSTCITCMCGLVNRGDWTVCVSPQ